MSRRRKNSPQKIFAAHAAFLTVLVFLPYELKTAHCAQSFYNKTCLFLPIRVGIEKNSRAVE